MLEDLYKAIKDIKRKSPVLLLDQAAILFKENYSGQVYQMECNDDLEDFVTRFSTIDYDKLVVLDGINNITNTSLLLKFLEKVEFPLILLSIRDSGNLYNTIYSRLKTVIKIPYSEGKCNLTNASDAISMWNGKVDKTDIDRFYATESPELYYLKYKSNTYVCNTKIVDLLSSEV